MKIEKEELVFIGLALVALVALVIYRKPLSPLNDPITEQIFGNGNTGPAYLMGNMPWSFQPWVGNVIPQATAGQVGQVAALTPTPGSQSNPLNCYGNC